MQIGEAGPGHEIVEPPDDRMQLLGQALELGDRLRRDDTVPAHVLRLELLDGDAHEGEVRAQAVRRTQGLAAGAQAVAVEHAQQLFPDRPQVIGDGASLGRRKIVHIRREG